MSRPQSLRGRSKRDDWAAQMKPYDVTERSISHITHKRGSDIEGKPIIDQSREEVGISRPILCHNDLYCGSDAHSNNTTMKVNHVT